MRDYDGWACPQCWQDGCEHELCMNRECSADHCEECMEVMRRSEEREAHNLHVANANANARMWNLVGGFECDEEVIAGIRCNLPLGHDGDHRWRSNG